MPKNVTALLHAGQYLACALSNSCVTTVLSVLQKARGKKAQHRTYCFKAHGTSMRGSCPWTGCLCITLCAWTQALCQGKQPLGTHETFDRRTRGAPCRADAGMWGQGSSRAGFPPPCKDFAFLPPPWGCSVNIL